MNDSFETKPLFQKIFSRSKIVCFGRYALQVPGETEILWGDASFPSKVGVIKGGLVEAGKMMEKDIEELRWTDKTFELLYKGDGPIADSLQIRYYDNEFAKEDNFVMFRTYVSKQELTFLLRDATRERETQDFVGSRQMSRARSLSLRAESDIPTTPGYCIETAL